MLSDLFDTSSDEVDLNTSPDTIEAWDSIGHMRLIASIEEKYDLTISPEEQVEMLNVDLILGLLVEKLIES
jgi:acyl carrier protein